MWCITIIKDANIFFSFDNEISTFFLLLLYLNGKRNVNSNMDLLNIYLI